MPARATRIYTLTREAAAAGLVFATPAWWHWEDRGDASLREVYAERRIALPDREDVLFLEWTDLLTFDLRSGRKAWSLPGPELPPEAVQPEGQALLERVQAARWFIVGREQTWMVPEDKQPGCTVFPAPIWWSYGSATPERWKARTFELANPLWLEHVSLFTGPEMQALHAQMWEAYLAWHRERGWKVEAHHHRNMRRIARILQEAVWVVVYEYEWESGLA